MNREIRIGLMQSLNLFDEIAHILRLLDSLERLFENNCLEEAHCLFGLLTREIEPKAVALKKALESTRKTAFGETDV
jgi:hypothetical protein